MNKAILAFTFSLVVIIILLAGCNQKPADTEPADSEPTHSEAAGTDYVPAIIDNQPTHQPFETGKELTDIDEIIKNIKQSAANLTGYTYSAKADASRFLTQDGKEESFPSTLQINSDIDLKNRREKGTSIITEPGPDEGGPDYQKETVTYLYDNIVYFSEGIPGEQKDWRVISGGKETIPVENTIQDEIQILHQAPKKSLSPSEKINDTDCYVISLEPETNTLLNSTIIASFYEVLMVESREIDIFAPYIKEHSYKQYYSKEDFTLRRVYQYLVLSIPEEKNSAVMTYEWTWDFTNHNQAITVNLPDEVMDVIIKDPYLSKGIREAIGKEKGALTREDLLSVKEFKTTTSLNDITGLRYCTNLESLELTAEIQDLSELSALKKLTQLTLVFHGTTDISPLSSLENLEYLKLYGQGITDITPLSKLTRLTTLKLGWKDGLDLTRLADIPNLTSFSLGGYQKNDLSWVTSVPKLKELYLPTLSAKDISALAALTDLKVLSIEGRGVSDISVLASLKSLEKLELEISRNADFRPIAGLTQLKYLRLSSHEINDISLLKPLTRLNVLIIDRNKITDLTPLSGLSELTQLELSSNQFTSLEPLANLKNLESLDLGMIRPKLMDISALSGLTKLNRLWLLDNAISDIKPLASLTHLSDLNLNFNQIEDISTLANLTELTDLVISGNPIQDISSLVQNSGLGEGDELTLEKDTINDDIKKNIEILEQRGVKVEQY